MRNGSYSRCHYFYCKNNSNTHPDLSFFRFPVKDEERCHDWMIRSGRDEFKQLPNNRLANKRICSNHFDCDQFMNSERNSLVNHAVPKTCFDSVSNIEPMATADGAPIAKVFSKAEERMLKTYLVQCSKMCYGKSTKNIRELAYEMAKMNNKKIPKSWETNKKAGIGWMEGFFKRHPTVRHYERCRLSRLITIKTHNVRTFYKNLECALNKSDQFADGTRIYNLDEIPITILRSRCSMALVTCCCIISGSGSSIPPALVFPRNNFEPHMISGAPPGTLGLATSSGWMTDEVFISVMNHFIKYSRSSIIHPTVLIMDCLESHLSIRTLHLARENGVNIVTVPPHNSHKFQPIQVSVTAPFVAHYKAAAGVTSHGYLETTTKFGRVAECVAAALEQTLVPQNIKEGFRTTGIFPFNKNISRSRSFPQKCEGPKGAEQKKNEKGESCGMSTNTGGKNKIEVTLNERVLRKRKTSERAVSKKVFTLKEKVEELASSSSEDENEMMPQVKSKLCEQLDRESVEKSFDVVKIKEELSQFEVEFKPEMWEDDSSKEPVAKKPKNSQKKILSDNSETNKEDGSSSGTVACCALACPNTHETHSMVRLPQDEQLRAQWVRQIGRSLMDWTPDQHSALCEVHFDEAQWDRNEEGARVLRPDAVPSLALRGEAIKSWVTLDATVLKQGECNGNAEERESDMEEESDIFIKREALEPEIDMVEGSEAVLSQDVCPQDPFETIYCDSTFREDEDNLNGDPHNVQIKFEREDEDYNDESMNPLGDSESEGGTDESPSPTSLHVKAALRKKVRRSSSQLTDDFQCPICDRKLSRRKNLEIHIKKLHPNGEMSEIQKRQKAVEDSWKLKPKKTLKSPPPLTPIHMNVGPAPYPIIGSVFSTAVPSSNLVTKPPGVAIPTSPTPSLFAPSKTVNNTEKSISTPKLLASPTIIVQPSKDMSPKTSALSSGVSTPSPLSMVTSSVVSMPRPNDPSPAGGEIHKQFVLLLPNSLGNKLPPPATKEDVFSINLANVPLDRRLALIDKLKELVDAVVTKKLDPEKIIIAYDRTSDC